MPALWQEEAESEDDGLGAYNVLRTLATVLESVSSQPALFPEVCRCIAAAAAPVLHACTPSVQQCTCCTLPAISQFVLSGCSIGTQMLHSNSCPVCSWRASCFPSCSA